MSDKMYISGDGLLKLRNNSITHVCIAPSLFPLLQYLLLVDEETARRHTYYFCSNVIPASLSNRLACTRYVQRPDSSLMVALKKRIHKLLISFFKTWKYPFLKRAHIYAFDYPVLCLYIGNRPYEMLSDAPQCFTYNMREDSEEYLRQIARRKTFQWWIQKIIYGDVYVDYYGNNPWCQVIHLTEENDSPILKNKKTCIQSLEALWSSSSESKKQFILSLFNITSEDIEILSSKPILFFSQPFREDCKLSDAEYCELLRKVLSHYNTKDVMIKTHPRDKFDYSQYFPEVAVYSKSVNSQLLQLLGLTPKRVVTFFSSSVEAFPDSVECDCYGTNIHPNVFALYGDAYKLKRRVNKVEL
jgi:hypothetical protein